MSEQMTVEIYVLMVLICAGLLAIYLLAFQRFLQRLDRPGLVAKRWDYLLAWTVFLIPVLLAVLIHLLRERRGHPR